MSDRLVLASASPRRKELLSSAGFAFEVDSAEVDETPPPNVSGAAPIATALAVRKAAAVLARRRSGDPERAKSEVVLAADTVVWIRGELLAKPADAADARRMLTLLAGTRHVVATGWCVARADASGRESSGAAITRVLFQPITPAQIDAYIATGEPFDKAGGYAIQGKAGLFVRSIAGSYSNVVGLPLAQTVEALAAVSDLRPFGLQA